ncbi:hypothetical protein M9H77_28178 [Catharanthus roseus]|uniref:Uncharacterized protein n=1 Tax=Catharanthus roseus TaxID=4058 RepID=A0ACC0AG92_CATRO|nr:hypothetical protein M9H77_28178 [Catharanthus roseus]
MAKLFALFFLLLTIASFAAVERQVAEAKFCLRESSKFSGACIRGTCGIACKSEGADHSFCLRLPPSLYLKVQRKLVNRRNCTSKVSRPSFSSWVGVEDPIRFSIGIHIDLPMLMGPDIAESALSPPKLADQYADVTVN